MLAYIIYYRDSKERYKPIVGRSPFSHLNHPNPNVTLTLILTLTNPNLNTITLP